MGRMRRVTYRAIEGLMSWSGYRLQDGSPIIPSEIGDLFDAGSGDPLSLPEWKRGVSMLAEAVGWAPRCVYRRTDGGSEKLASHPTSIFLYGWSDPDMAGVLSTAGVVEEMHAQVIQYGEACAIVGRDAQGRVNRLKFYPDLKWDRDAKKYRNGSEALKPRDVLRVHGMQVRGRPLSTVEMASADIKLQQLARFFGTGFFERGAAPSGFYKTRAFMSDEQKKALMDQLRGVGKSHGTPVLEGDVEYQEIGVDAEKTQMLGVREHGTRVAAQSIGTNPISLGDMSRSTYNTAEHARLDFLGGSIKPAVRRWDHLMTLAFLPPNEIAAGHYIRTDLRDLSMGDRATRAKSLQLALGGEAFMTQNEAREMEGLPTMEGEQYNQIPESRMNKAASGTNVPGEGSAE